MGTGGILATFQVMILIPDHESDASNQRFRDQSAVWVAFKTNLPSFTIQPNLHLT